MNAEARLTDLGLSLPAPLAVPPSISLPFTWVRVHGRRAFISGHSPVALDGSLYTPRGKVGHELSEEEGYAAAKSAAYGMASRRRVRELPAALQSDNGGH